MTYAFRKSCEAVKEAVSLVEYIEARGLTELRRRGSVFVGLCPVHEEKTPSFTVWPDSGTWWCFGCMEGSDVIDLHALVGKSEETGLWTAMISLAEEYGVELPGRSERWHEATHRKSEYLEAAARVKGDILKRRLFRRLILPHVNAIEGAAEREAELERAWSQWDDALFWPRFGETFVERAQ